jgi:ubiquinone/menaquinone biosynthesis C-methylase UbiE
VDEETRRFSLLPEIQSHYGTGYEGERLQRGGCRLELARTQIILRRYLPPPPARVLDIGGGPGVYAAWLASLGYQVQLLDPIPVHIEQAQEASRRQPASPFLAELGDARALPYQDRVADAVLLLGPLYRLTERDERVLALREARRVLQPGAVLVAAAISRFASLLDGLHSAFLNDPAFVRIVERDLTDGQHQNPGDHPHYFTTAFFHHPDELAQEVSEAGLTLEAVLAVEGPGWVLPDLDEWWRDSERRERLLHLIAAVEREPSLLGMSGHLLAVARRPDG